MLQPLDIEIVDVVVFPQLLRALAAHCGAPTDDEESGLDDASAAAAATATVVVQLEYRGTFQPGVHLAPALAVSSRTVQQQAATLGLAGFRSRLESADHTSGDHVVVQQHQCQPVQLAADRTADEARVTTSSSAAVDEALRLHVPHSFQLPPDVRGGSPSESSFHATSLPVPPFGHVSITAVCAVAGVPARGASPSGLQLAAHTAVATGSIDASSLVALATLRPDELDAALGGGSGDDAALPPRVLSLPLFLAAARGDGSAAVGAVTLHVRPTVAPPPVAVSPTPVVASSFDKGATEATRTMRVAAPEVDATEEAEARDATRLLPLEGSFLAAALHTEASRAVGESGAPPPPLLPGSSASGESGGTGGGSDGSTSVEAAAPSAAALQPPVPPPPGAAAAASGSGTGPVDVSAAARAHVTALVAELLTRERVALAAWAAAQRADVERSWRAEFAAREAARLGELEAAAAAKEAARQAAAESAVASVAAVESRLRRLLVAAEGAAREAAGEKSDAAALSKRLRADAEHASALAAQRAAAAEARATALADELRASRARAGELEAALHAARLRGGGATQVSPPPPPTQRQHGSFGDAPSLPQQQQLMATVAAATAAATAAAAAHDAPAAAAAAATAAAASSNSSNSSVLALAGQLAEARGATDVAERDRDALRLQVARLAGEVARSRATAERAAFAAAAAVAANASAAHSLSLNGTLLHNSDTLNGTRAPPLDSDGDDGRRLRAVWRPAEQSFGLQGDRGALRDIAAQASQLLGGERSTMITLSPASSQGVPRAAARTAPAAASAAASAAPTPLPRSVAPRPVSGGRA